MTGTTQHRSYTPSRAEFIRDQLADHLADLGWEVWDMGDEVMDQWPTLSVSCPSQTVDLYVDGDTGLLHDMEGGARLRFPGFEWMAEPMDVGVVLGPARPGLISGAGLDVVCPSCGAAPMRPCRQVAGSATAHGMHDARLDRPRAFVGHRVHATTRTA